MGYVYGYVVDDGGAGCYFCQNSSRGGVLGSTYGSGDLVSIEAWKDSFSATSSESARSSFVLRVKMAVGSAVLRSVYFFMAS